MSSRELLNCILVASLGVLACVVALCLLGMWNPVLIPYLCFGVAGIVLWLVYHKEGG